MPVESEGSSAMELMRPVTRPKLWEATAIGPAGVQVPGVVLMFGIAPGVGGI